MRRFFALLAILTGLTAVAAPANATIASGACQQVSSGEIAQSAKSVRCASAVKCRNSECKIAAVRACIWRAPVTVDIPTVHFGADRAYE